MENFENIRTLIIPDVHGRNFFIGPLESYLENSNGDVIFLGDYLDPYSHEGITREQSITVFEEILNYKIKYPDRISLLFGNHDFHYLFDNGYGARYDRINHNLYNEMFNDNADLFYYIKTDVVNNKNIVYSHAGILEKWFTNHWDVFGIGKNDIVEFDLIRNFDWNVKNNINNFKLINALSEVGRTRGGYYPFPSIIWSDVLDHIDLDDSKYFNFIQIFGHTQLKKDCINYNNEWFCIDRREVCYLTNDGKVVDKDLIDLPLTSFNRS